MGTLALQLHFCIDTSTVLIFFYLPKAEAVIFDTGCFDNIFKVLLNLKH